MKMKKLTGITVSAVMAVMLAVPGYADTYDKMDQARAEKEAAEDALYISRERIEDMKGEKNALATYLDELGAQITELQTAITDLASQIATKETDVEMAKAAVSRAKINERRQYDGMISRIQYMYENGSTDLLVELLSTPDLTEFLNRAAEAQDMTRFDREKLEQYRMTKEAVAGKQKALEDEQASLQQLKDENDAKLQEVKTLADTTDAKIAEFTAAITEEEYRAGDLEGVISYQKERLAELSAQAAAEEEARRQAEARAAEEARRAAERAESEETHEESSDYDEDEEVSSYEDSSDEDADSSDDESYDDESDYDEDESDSDESDYDEDADYDESDSDEDEDYDESDYDEDEDYDESDSDEDEDYDDSDSEEDEDYDESDYDEDEDYDESDYDEDEDYDDSDEDEDYDDSEEGDSEGTYLGNFKLTAYCWCASCNGVAGQPTASGATPYSGHTVAMAGVDFGTKLLINGTVYTVEDRGTPYGHVDIFMDSHEEALEFGLQYADVYQLN